MRIVRAGVVAAAVGLGLVLAGCSAEQVVETDPPSTLVEVEGSDEPDVVLTADAAEAAGVATTAVAAGSAPHQLDMPSSALMYYLDGTTWAYTVARELTYRRVAVTVDRIVGDVVHLSEGPAVGTEVVSTGAPLILGAELEIDGEQ